MVKMLLRLEAESLRRSGLGIKVIASRLGVSSSTVSLWCRDIQLTADQIRKLSQNAHDPYYGKRAENIAKQKKIREDKIQKLFNIGINEVGKLDHRDLFISGIALYWAEGFKKDNLVGFSNSDPKMIERFIQWLVDCCGVSRDRLRFRLGVNEYYKKHVRKIESYWSLFLNIPKNQFQKPFFQKVQRKKIYSHPEDYHGVLRVRVAKSTDLLRKILGWIEGLKMAPMS